MTEIFEGVGLYRRTRLSREDAEFIFAIPLVVAVAMHIVYIVPHSLSFVMIFRLNRNSADIRSPMAWGDTPG